MTNEEDFEIVVNSLDKYIKFEGIGFVISLFFVAVGMIIEVYTRADIGYFFLILGGICLLITTILFLILVGSDTRKFIKKLQT